MNTNTWPLSLIKISRVVLFIALVAIASIAPLGGNQFITGAIVNAVLIISIAWLGMRNALLVGIIPSTIALATGLLPAVLAPMVPFIIIGNAILVMVFGFLMNKNYWFGAFLAAILKFVFLWATSSVVIGLVLNKQLAGQVATMMSWPQLVTAVSGSILAFGAIRLANAIKK